MSNTSWENISTNKSKWNTIGMAGVITAASLGIATMTHAGKTHAAEQDRSPADQCIQSLFNQAAKNAAKMPTGVTLTMRYNTEDLISHCEEKTDSKVDTYKDLKGISYPVGPITLVFE